MNVSAKAKNNTHSEEHIECLYSNTMEIAMGTF